MLNAYTHFKREDIRNINTPYTVSFFVFVVSFCQIVSICTAPPPNKTNKLKNKQNKQNNQTNTKKSKRKELEQPWTKIFNEHPPYEKQKTKNKTYKQLT